MERLDVATRLLEHSVHPPAGKRGHRERSRRVQIALNAVRGCAALCTTRAESLRAHVAREVLCLAGMSRVFGAPLLLLVLLAASPATAQHRDHSHGVFAELQARVGAGASWIEGDRSVLGVSETGRGEATGNLGAILALRDRATGLGGALAYSHVFTGDDEHYGTHAIELRISERYTVFRHSMRDFEVSLLAEVGVLLAVGGATNGCWSWGLSNCDDHIDTSVGATVVGTVAAVGFLVRHGVLLAGIEVDGRLVGALEGPVGREIDVLGMGRVGFVLDL